MTRVRRPHQRYRRCTLALLCYSLMASVVTPQTVHAAAESAVKDTARNGNCKPGKIEVLRTAPGRTPETYYKVACTGGSDKGVFIVVVCRGELCTISMAGREEVKS